MMDPTSNGNDKEEEEGRTIRDLVLLCPDLMSPLNKDQEESLQSVVDGVYPACKRCIMDATIHKQNSTLGGVSMELLEHLLVQEEDVSSGDDDDNDDDGGSHDDNDNEGDDVDEEDATTSTTNTPQHQQPRLWSFKPPLLALLWTVEVWYQTNTFPVRNHDTYCIPGVDSEILPTNLRTSQYATEVLASYSQLREDATTAAAGETKIPDDEHLSEEGSVGRIRTDLDDFLTKLGGKPGILYFLGHRSTVGSLDRLCPSLTTLLASFQQLHHKTSMSRLSVGGRALTKHWHRNYNNATTTDSNANKSSFWPQSTGNDLRKNQLALEALQKILDDVAWINVHVVPMGDGQQLPVVEIRHRWGYGARWSADGKDFRGFLEPVSPFFEEQQQVAASMTQKNAGKNTGDEDVI